MLEGLHMEVRVVVAIAIRRLVFLNERQQVKNKLLGRYEQIRGEFCSELLVVFPFLRKQS